MRRLATAASAALIFACAPAVAIAAPRAVPRSFVGAMADGPLVTPWANVPGEMDRMVGAGVESVRFVADWADAQPYPNFGAVPQGERARFRDEGGVPTDYTTLDARIGAAAQRRLTVLPVVTRSPGWAALHSASYTSPPRSAATYARFVAALAHRYGRGGTFWLEHPELPLRPLRYWQFWNEPNLVEHWDEQPYARRYVQLLRVARRKLLAADPHARIVLAGLPNRSWEELARIYRAGARGLFDVVAIHPFTARVPGVVEILARARRVMRANGDSRKPLWVTELSWTSARGKAHWTYGNETTEAGQARNLSHVYALLARERRRLRLQRAYWYTWMSVETNPDYPFDYAGLLRVGPDGAVVEKPAYAALRRTALGLEACGRKSALADVCAEPR
jgi:hypothetical protein